LKHSFEKILKQFISLYIVIDHLYVIKRVIEFEPGSTFFHEFFLETAFLIALEIERILMYKQIV